MSVSKQYHDATPIRPLDSASSADATSVREKLTLVRPSGNPQSFWEEFNGTLDEFFRTIHAAKTHIHSLSAKLAERDRRIELLEAENAALRDQVELQQPEIQTLTLGNGGGDAHAHSRTEPRASHAAEDRPVVAAKPGIWSKLTRLERDTGAAFDLKD